MVRYPSIAADDWPGEGPDQVGLRPSESASRAIVLPLSRRIAYPTIQRVILQQRGAGGVYPSFWGGAGGARREPAGKRARLV